jgi:hypothetical protein
MLSPRGRALLALAANMKLKPRIIVFVTDDQCADTLQYMASVKNIMQEQGIKFDNAINYDSVLTCSGAVAFRHSYDETWARSAFNADFYGTTVTVSQSAPSALSVSY